MSSLSSVSIIGVLSAYRILFIALPPNHEYDGLTASRKPLAYVWVF